MVGPALVRQFRPYAYAEGPQLSRNLTLRVLHPRRGCLPTVTLAVRIAGVPTILVGNGFELPPTTDPLPHFPGFSWATQEKAAKAEQLAVANANSVLSAYRAPPITALRDLVVGHTSFLTTFPELDHYGERTEVQYIGPLLGQFRAPRVGWPDGQGPKIFACVRRDTANVQTILTALSEMPARVVCVATGFSRSVLATFTRADIRFTLGPVDLDPLLDADVCITYVRREQ